MQIFEIEMRLRKHRQEATRAPVSRNPRVEHFIRSCPRLLRNRRGSSR